MYAMFNKLSEPGGVDKRFGKKAYSDSYDNLYMVESPFLMLAGHDGAGRPRSRQRSRSGSRRRRSI